MKGKGKEGRERQLCAAVEEAREGGREKVGRGKERKREEREGERGRGGGGSEEERARRRRATHEMNSLVVGLYKVHVWAYEASCILRKPDVGLNLDTRSLYRYCPLLPM